MSIIISQTNKGKIEYCKGCDRFYLVYENILLCFTEFEYYHFERLLFDIEVEQWVEYNKEFSHKKFIPIQTEQRNLTLMLDENDLIQLKQLFLGENAEILNINQIRIDYSPN